MLSISPLKRLQWCRSCNGTFPTSQSNAVMHVRYWIVFYTHIVMVIIYLSWIHANLHVINFQRSWKQRVVKHLSDDSFILGINQSPFSSAPPPPPPPSTFDSRIHAVFWQNSRGHACWGPVFTCTHFLMFFVGPYRTVGTICNDCRFFPYPAGGLGVLNLPPAGPGQRSGGCPGGKAPWSFGNLAF